MPLSIDNEDRQFQRFQIDGVLLSSIYPIGTQSVHEIGSGTEVVEIEAGAVGKEGRPTFRSNGITNEYRVRLLR